MSDYRLSHDEFDYIMELIAAVLFMSIGIVGIVFMVNQFNRQIQLNPRVDKVRVSSIDQVEGNPFDFTAYQAYMFSWMMDGHDKTALYYFADTDPTASFLREEFTGNGFPRSGKFIGLCPGELANGFIVIRNRAIIGAEDYAGGSVKETIYESYGNNEHNVQAGYQSIDNPEWILEFTDKHVDMLTQDYSDESKTNLFEERKDYIWSLHRCSHD